MRGKENNQAKLFYSTRKSWLDFSFLLMVKAVKKTLNGRMSKYRTFTLSKYTNWFPKTFCIF